MARTKRKTNPLVQEVESSAPARKIYKTAAYVRLSVEDSGKPGADTIEGQKALLTSFIENKSDMELVALFCDNGRTGTDFDRPQFEKMMEEVRKCRVNCIVVKDLSRFGRNYKETGNYLERIFPFLGVRFIAVNDNFDTLTAERTQDGYIVPLKNLINEVYSKDISKKIKSVKRDKQRKGQFIGGKALYGYKMHPTEKNKIVIDEEVAPIVRRIFAMALDGMSCRKIAATLNGEGIPTPATYANLPVGNPGPYTGLWSSERISDMLQNETYIGNMVQGRMVKVNYKSKKCLRQPREKWVIVEGTHDPLVDRETFQKVRLLVESRKHTRSRTYDFLLKGLIFCHECGYPLATLNRKNSAGEERLFFVCRTYQRFTKAGICTCHSIKEQTVTEAVLAKVREVCQAYLNADELLPMAQKAVEAARAADSTEAEIQALRNRIDTMTANLDRMYMDKLSGILREDDFQRIYLKVKSDRAKLEDQLKELEKKKESPAKSEDEAKELVQRFLENACTSRELLVSLIERIELSEDKQLYIKFRFKQLNSAQFGAN